MAHVTIQVIQGLERGRVYENLPTPVTIGREDDNVIQLNDERVSRFHVKLQDDGSQIILTDLESTNGTRVNGHPVQMRVLQVGDQLTIGRCILLFGSREQLQGRVSSDCVPSDKTQFSAGEIADVESSAAVRGGAGESLLEDEPAELFPQGPPPLPEGLRPLQTTRFSDVIAFVHDRLGDVLQSGIDRDRQNEITVSREEWNRLLALEMDLARYLREMASPK